MTDTLFREKAPGIMALLMADFGLDAEGAAAILGNLGHESGGFRFLQEKQPLVPGSAGGYGWAQWTGSRRNAYEAYCERNGLDAAGDKANYGWLWVELKGDEAKAIPAVKAAGSLYEKVVAFENAFERAGVKAYDSRLNWANKALAAFHAAGDPAPVRQPPQEVITPVTKIDTSTIRTEIEHAIGQMLVQALTARLQGTTGAQPGQGTDLAGLIAQVMGGAAPQPVIQPPPPKPPEPPVATKPGSSPLTHLFNILLGSGTAAAMSADKLGTPFGFGADPTLSGSLMTIASIASAAVSLMPGGYGAIASAALDLVKRGAKKLAA